MNAMLTLDPVPLALELHNQRPWDHHWVELFPSCSSHLLLSLSYPNVRRNFCLLTSVEMHSHEELVQVKSTYTFRQGWAWVYSYFSFVTVSEENWHSSPEKTIHSRAAFHSTGLRDDGTSSQHRRQQRRILAFSSFES